MRFIPQFAYLKTFYHMKMIKILRELNAKLREENERLQKENDELKEEVYGLRIMQQVAIEETAKYQDREKTHPRRRP
jgi:cell division protein FtsB